MEQAMTNTANENNGVSRAELLGFTWRMQTQQSSANAALQQQMNDHMQNMQMLDETNAEALAQSSPCKTASRTSGILRRTNYNKAWPQRTKLPLPYRFRKHLAGSDPALPQMLAAGQTQSQQRTNAHESWMPMLGQTSATQFGMCKKMARA
jgi:hypothetical protein